MKINNQTALELNRSIFEPMKETCLPLKNFGITAVAYGRFYNNNNRLYLNNNPQFREFYFKEELYNDFNHTIFYTPSLNTKYILWSSVKRDKVFEIMDHTNICNGFSIYETHQEYFEYFGFGGDRDNNNIANYCINHLEAFEEFKTIFREKNAHILNSTDQSRLIIPKQTNFHIPTKRPYLIENSKIENFKKQIGFFGDL